MITRVPLFPQRGIDRGDFLLKACANRCDQPAVVVDGVLKPHPIVIIAPAQGAHAGSGGLEGGTQAANFGEEAIG